MRDYLILAVILSVIPFCLRPFFGVLTWSWVSYFNPHRYAWSKFVYTFPIAYAVAVPTLLGLIFSREKLNRDIFRRETILIFLLWVWMIVSLLYASQVPLFSGHMQDGTNRLIQITKVLLMTLATLLVINSRPRLRQLMLVIALSFAVRAVWTMIFAVQTGGESRIWGPHDSFIEDNNDFALALNMILPILYFLIPGEQKRWVRNALRICFVATIFAVLLTYSRGGLLGLMVVLFLITMMSRFRVVALGAIAVLGLLVFSYAPERWMSRMQGFANGEVDESAQQRLITWRTGWNLAMDYPLTGGGLEVYPDVVVFQTYQPEPLPRGRQSEGPHSIYFQVLGEEGFVGLGLFLLLLGSCAISLSSVQRAARKTSSSHWAIPYARMFQVSLAAFAVSGAFLGRAYFDLWFEIVACIVVVQMLYRREKAEERVSRIVPAATQPGMEPELSAAGS